MATLHLRSLGTPHPLRSKRSRQRVTQGLDILQQESKSRHKELLTAHEAIVATLKKSRSASRSLDEVQKALTERGISKRGQRAAIQLLEEQGRVRVTSDRNKAKLELK